MIYPKFLKKGDTIGVTACSGGYSSEPDLNKIANAKKQVEGRGMNVVYTENVTTDMNGRSSGKLERAEQFNRLVSDPGVDSIAIARGGDYMPEMLPYADFEAIRKNPKWIQGMSDPTSLLFAITTKLDIATLYSENFGAYGRETWDPAVERSFSALFGDISEQKSFDSYQAGWRETVTGLEGLVPDTPVRWYGARGENEISVKGRLIGGCLDCIVDMIGMPYQDVSGFIERYKEDGILWFLESFDLSTERLTIALWRMKEAGWFKYASGIVFGRPAMYESWSDTPYETAVLAAISELDVPIICGADIGHRDPTFSIINGAYGRISLKDGKGSLKTELR